MLVKLMLQSRTHIQVKVTNHTSGLELQLQLFIVIFIGDCYIRVVDCSITIISLSFAIILDLQVPGTFLQEHHMFVVQHNNLIW